MMQYYQNIVKFDISFGEENYIVHLLPLHLYACCSKLKKQIYERNQTKNSNCWLMIDIEDLQAKLDKATKGRASADVPLKKEVKSKQMRNRKWSKEEQDI